MGVTTWTCTRPNCGTHNLAAQPFCTVCQAPPPHKSAFRSAIDERRIPPVDLEEFLRRNFSRGAKRHAATVDIVNNEVFLTLAPNPADAIGDPAIYVVDENDLVPCDNFGRRSW